MGRVFIVLGLAILLGLMVFPASIDRAPPNLPSVGFGANARYVIPPEEVRATLERANTATESLSGEGAELARLGGRLLQAVIVIGALISITAGFQRIAKARSKPDLAHVTIMALLGAASAVTTTAAGHVEARGKARFACADEITASTYDTLENVTKETNEELARQYLVELEQKVTRCAAG